MATSVLIDSGETYRIRNDHGNKALEFKYGPIGREKKWSIPPGHSALVPFEVIRIWWGDPRCHNGVMVKFDDSGGQGRVNSREKEIARLGVWYGSYATDVDTLLDPEWPIGDDRRGKTEKTTPHPISVQTEGGDKVIPACFDRTGEDIYGSVMVTSEDLSDEVAYRQHLEKRLDDVQRALAEVSGNNSDAEVDTPAGR